MSTSTPARYRIRPWVHLPGLGPMDELMIGDHLEALSELLNAGGEGTVSRPRRGREGLIQRSLMEAIRL